MRNYSRKQTSMKGGQTLVLSSKLQSWKSHYRHHLRHQAQRRSLSKNPTQPQRHLRLIRTPNFLFRIPRMHQPSHHPIFNPPPSPSPLNSISHNHRHPLTSTPQTPSSSRISTQPTSPPSRPTLPPSLGWPQYRKTNPQHTPPPNPPSPLPPSALTSAAISYLPASPPNFPLPSASTTMPPPRKPQAIPSPSLLIWPAVPFQRSGA